MQESQELEDRAELKTSVRVFAHRSKTHVTPGTVRAQRFDCDRHRKVDQVDL